MQSIGVDGAIKLLSFKCTLKTDTFGFSSASQLRVYFVSVAVYQ